MSARPIRLDFQPQPRRFSWVATALLVCGVAAAGAVGVQYDQDADTYARLSGRLEALESAKRRTTAAQGATAGEETMPVLEALAAPWSPLLAELEAASHDLHGGVALLSVQPDRSRGRIRIRAEARTLPGALTYVERLQRSRVLRFPILDSHEIRTDDKDQPVRFELSADWRARP